jgi:hypothetical protein
MTLEQLKLEIDILYENKEYRKKEVYIWSDYRLKYIEIEDDIISLD